MKLCCKINLLNRYITQSDLAHGMLHVIELSVKGDFFVDITDTMDQKLKAISEHKSQFQDFELFKRYLQEGLPS